MGKKYPSFSIDFKNKKYSESEKFTSVAKAYNSEHFIYEVDENMIEYVDIMLSACDEPFGDMAALPTYLLSLNSSKMIKVALSGDGSDEYMYGYSYHGFKNQSMNIFESKLLHSLIKLIPILHLNNFRYYLELSLMIIQIQKNLYQMLFQRIIKNSKYSTKKELFKLCAI